MDTQINPTANNGYMARRGLKLDAKSLEKRQHGERLRYVAGCRCDLCRKANTAYEIARQKARAGGDWNGLVDAAPARQHLLFLSGQGIGRRAVSAATDISESLLSSVRRGERLKIRARTERLILGVTPAVASDHALIDAGPTWKLIRALQKAGFAQSRISLEMGNSGRSLQLAKDKVTVRNAARLEAAYTRLMASDEVLVPAAPSLRRLKALREEEFTEKQLARWLEMPGAEYQIPDKMISRGLETRIAALFARLMS